MVIQLKFMENIPVYTCPYISCEDIEDIMGFRWDQIASFREVENDSYNPINLDDATLEELYEDLEWCKNKFNDEYVKQIENQIKLIERLRSQGYRDSILVYIYW